MAWLGFRASLLAVASWWLSRQRLGVLAVVQRSELDLVGHSGHSPHEDLIFERVHSLLEGIEDVIIEPSDIRLLDEGFADADVDKSGILEEKEVVALIESRSGAEGPVLVPQWRTFDEDADGVLSEAEYLKLDEAIAAVRNQTVVLLDDGPANERSEVSNIDGSTTDNATLSQQLSLGSSGSFFSPGEGPVEANIPSPATTGTGEGDVFEEEFEELERLIAQANLKDEARKMSQQTRRDPTRMAPLQRMTRSIENMVTVL